MKKRMIILLALLITSLIFWLFVKTGQESHKRDKQEGPYKDQWEYSDYYGGYQLHTEEGTKKNGKKEGHYKEYVYDKDKKILCREEGIYKNDKREGLYKSYDENGKLSAEGTYKNGRIDGLRKTYYPSGQLQEEEIFKDGEKIGTPKEYNEDGSIKQQPVNATQN